MEAVKWTMPKWMEKYRELIGNTGGNSIEEMVDDQSDPQINLPRAVLAACVKSQINFLMRLKTLGLLKENKEV